MVYTYKEWMTVHCNDDNHGCEENCSLAEKIAELLDKNGYKNEWGSPNIEYRVAGAGANIGGYILVEPVGGALVNVHIHRYDEEEEIVRIHPDECFYAEDYVLCDTHTRLAHAVLDVVNKVYGKEGE